MNLDFFLSGFHKPLAGSRTAQTGTYTETAVQSMSQVFVKLEQKHPAVAAWTALCPSLLVELTLATPGLLSSSAVSNTVFLSTSFVENCVVERCFIRLDLLSTDLDKHFTLGHYEHLICTFLPFTSSRLK